MYAYIYIKKTASPQIIKKNSIILGSIDRDDFYFLRTLPKRSNNKNVSPTQFQIFSSPNRFTTFQGANILFQQRKYREENPNGPSHSHQIYKNGHIQHISKKKNSDTSIIYS